MKAFYDEFDYPGYWRGRDYEDKAEKIALKKLFALISQRNSLIDVGAGFGRHTPLYAPFFKQCVLVDPSKKLLAEAKSRLAAYSGLTFRIGNAENLPAEPESFQVALLVRVLHHLQEPEKAFREISMVLKPEGFLILEFANKIHFLAQIKAFFEHNSSFANDFSPAEKRSDASIREGKIIFSAHHPKKIEKDLKEAGFTIIICLSVSNLRLPLIKRIIPLPFLLSLENILQGPLAKFYFGPSIFILARKVS